MMNNLASYNNISNSGNMSLDVILNSCKIQCGIRGIDFIFDIRENTLLSMSDYDLVTVLSNASDNAIEAAEKKQ